MAYGNYRRGYNRRYRRRRVNGRKKPQQVPVQSNSTVKKLAGWVPWLLSNAMMVKRLINVEKKFIDTNVSGTVLDSGSIALLSGVAQGDDNSNRQGRSIRPMYIHINASMKLAAGNTQSQVRIICFTDSECNGSTPTVSDVINPQNPLGQYNITGSIGRFRVLYDKLFLLDNAHTRQAKIIHTCRMTGHIRYEGTAATIGSCGKNTVFLLYISDNATDQSTLSWYSRIRFVDN